MPATTAPRRRRWRRLPYIARSTAAIAGGKPFHAGPSALGMRSNPYGAAPMENPENIRQAMNRVDPRQRGLLGAAWYLGYFAHMARGGAVAVTLGGGVGPFGIVHAPAAHAQPWFDEAGGLYPAFHVFKGLAGLKGAKLLESAATPARNVQVVAAETATGHEIWLANLTGEATSVSVRSEDRAGPALRPRRRGFHGRRRRCGCGRAPVEAVRRRQRGARPLCRRLHHRDMSGPTFRLDGKVAVVTGGSKGIGKADRPGAGGGRRDASSSPTATRNRPRRSRGR